MAGEWRDPADLVEANRISGYPLGILPVLGSRWRSHPMPMAYEDPLQSLQASPLRAVLQQPAANLVELTSLPATPDIFAGQQLAYEFRWELDQRQAFEDYCRRYEAIALQNQQEAASMAKDVDVRSWFRWRR